jgi:hypothetical protein
VELEKLLAIEDGVLLYKIPLIVDQIYSRFTRIDVTNRDEYE